MKLTISASVEKFDKAKWDAAVKQAIRVCFMKAAQKFLLAAIPRIPIWTGMARGAFRNLEDIVGKVTNDAQSPTGVRVRTTQSASGRNTAGRGGGSKITAGYRRGYYYTPPGGGKIERTPQSGRQFATPGIKAFDLGGVSLATGNNAYYFRFEVNITYFDKLDAQKWGAWKAGSDAFQNYVEANLKLPDPLQFMTRKLVK